MTVVELVKLRKRSKLSETKEGGEVEEGGGGAGAGGGGAAEAEERLLVCSSFK